MNSNLAKAFLDWYRENKRFRYRMTMLSIFQAGYDFAMKEKNNE